MSGKDKTPGRFYANFKVHKPHNHKEAPPVRPMHSGSWSITEGIATFAEYHLKENAVTQNTYIQDTPDCRLQCMREQLQERTAHQVPSEYLLSLMEIMLIENIFVFHESLWKQWVGAAMGSKPVPNYANGFMARTIDKAFEIIASKYVTEEFKALQLLNYFWMIISQYLWEQQKICTNHWRK